jgi:signal transduction histidine kinase
MDSDWLSVLFWSVLTVVVELFAVGFGYLYYKDRDKRKLMFTLAFAFASLAYLQNIQPEWASIQIIEKSHSWADLPTISALFIAGLSSFLRLKDFDKQFKAFLCILALSIFMIVAPLPETFAHRPISYGMATILFVLLIYLVLKRRQIPDLMFLFSVIFFMLAGVGMAEDFASEFNVLTSFLGYVFIAFVFLTSKEGKEGDISSFFALKNELEKTQEELRISQEQLLKAERLAAIGELAAMVGHDLRNPLTGIIGATYYLKTKLGPEMDKKTEEMLEIIERDIEYSNKIVNDLIEYSREIQLELTETTPKSITNEALTLVKIPQNIRVRDLTKDEPKIKIDAERMKRVFVNIIQNAIDAMPEGGELTITSDELSGSLEIAFADTGVGMSKEIMEKLWTPLFTTKAKGMGLDLSTCKRIVEAHGGNISVESAVDEGTIFTVTIPVKPRIEGGEKVWLKPPESLLSTTTKA